MPPKRSKKGKDRAAADVRRKEQGITDDALADIIAGPAKVKSFGDTALKIVFPRLQALWEEYTSAHIPDGSLDFEVVFCPGSTTSLAYGHLSGFLLWYGRRNYGLGLSGPSKVRHRVSTFVLMWATFKALYHYHTCSPLEGNLAKSVTAYIKTGLKDALTLSEEAPNRSWLGFSDFRDIAEAFLSPGFPLATLRSRFNILLWLSITINTALRVGACLRNAQQIAAATRHETLRWKDITLVVFKDASSETNHLGFKFITPNGKTITSSSIEVVLSDQMPSWCNPVLWLLVIANSIDALPPGFTVAQLRSRTAVFGSLEDTVRELSFCSSVAELPVFENEVLGSSTPTESTTGYVDRYLEKVTSFLGYDRNISSHLLRRSVAIALKELGEWFTRPH